MSFYDDEISIQDAQPVELYIFTYKNVDYTYTSSGFAKSAYMNDKWFVFNPEYIKRGESLKTGNSNGNVETATITVSRTNNVALLYQGSPPEDDIIRVRVYRVHGLNDSDYALILRGVVTQVTFDGSYAELTVTIENVLNRLIPRGKLSYYCQNCIYDNKCTLKSDDFALQCYLDKSVNGLKLYSTNLREREEGWPINGFLKMGNSYRAIVKAEADWLQIKYPIRSDDWQGSFKVYPGCENTFSVCARKFENTDNFSGVPYIVPYNAFTHDTGHGVYWVDGNIVIRDTHGKLKTPNL